MGNVKKRGFKTKNVYKFQSQYFDFEVTGLRELWSLKEGINPSGSPKRFSSLMGVVKGETLSIDGWLVTKPKDKNPSRYSYTLMNEDNNIHIYTNDLNRFVDWLNNFSTKGGTWVLFP